MSDRAFRLVVGTGLVLFYALCASLLCGAAVEKLLLRRWVATPCVIESTSLVAVSGRPASGKDRGSRGGYRLDIVYRYQRDGRSWTGDRWELFDPGFGSKEELESKARGLPAGLQTDCWVHPGDASRALLHRDRLTEIDVGLLVLCGGVIPGLILGWIGVTIARNGRTKRNGIG